ncbi:flagellar protein FliT [Halobacillus salinarum]|uniref:Flagellar protein FliT n=1 Tax=Halobacillus salinarum TaxID=2932257 RepID=A0ABY4EMX3_9BACI|nr:flagellar protein FliT [Halobacillus salinarum]UOQ45735.1 flagellar protein FliT [Halobacillus salinarum]
MSVWKDFYGLTLKLELTLNENVTRGNRSEIIERVNDILDERSILMKELAQVQSAEERDMKEQVLAKEPELTARLDVLFRELKTEMRNVKKTKSSNQRYTNPYRSVSSYDGMFLDHRK